MGLENFKTANSKSSKFNNKSGSNSTGDSQRTLTGQTASDFIEEWSLTRSEAMRDPEWINERLSEGWSLDKFADELSTFPRTILWMFYRGVKVGYIDLEDIPDADLPNFTNHEISWYVDQAVKHDAFTLVPNDNTWRLTDNRKTLPDEYLKGINRYNDRKQMKVGSIDDESSVLDEF